MKKIALIMTLSSVLISIPALAQSSSFACQFVESAGLSWDNKKWDLKKFNKGGSFFLSSTNSTLDLQSVSKVLNVSQANVVCHAPFAGTQACADALGGGLIFNFKNMNGGISQLLGASMSDREALKDDVRVMTFTCTQM